MKPIILLFGPNSVGKSTIVQAILYAREILERNNLNADRTLYGGEVINLGGFKKLVYRYNLDLPIVMQFDLDLSNVDLPEYSDQYLEINISEAIETAWIKLTIKWHETSQQAVLTAYEVGINGVEIAKIITSEDGQNHSLQGKLNHPLVLSLFSYDIEEYVEKHHQIIDG
jgi:predicted ATPase